MNKTPRLSPRRTKRRLAMTTVLVIAATTLSAPLAAAANTPGQSRSCTYKTIAAADLAKSPEAGCDMTGVTVTTEAGFSMVVPPAGTGVSAYADSDSESSETPTVSLFHAEDGSVALMSGTDILSATAGSASQTLLDVKSPDTAASAKSNPGPPAGCSSYKLASGWWVNHRYDFHYNPADTPWLGLGPTVARSYLDGVSWEWNNRWTQPCSGTVNSGTDYRNDIGANTTATPGVNSSGGCTTPSGSNAIGWGPLDGSWLAMTCTWWNIFGQITNADIRFDNSDRNWTVFDELLDANTWSFDSVALHELGHAAGLDHTTDSTQVMYPYINGGQKKILIGTGDKAGIAAKYGSFICMGNPVCR